MTERTKLIGARHASIALAVSFHFGFQPAPTRFFQRH